MVSCAAVSAVSVSAARAAGAAAPSDTALPNAAVAGASTSTIVFSPSLAALTDAADAASHDTIEMQARKGRASYLGPRSVGHEDPGAASSALILHALRDVAARQAG